jgi:hypothetical protein
MSYTRIRIYLNLEELRVVDIGQLPFTNPVSIQNDSAGQGAIDPKIGCHGL